MKITSASPSITKKEISIVSDAIAKRWGSKMDFYLKLFSKKFSKFIGVKYCLPVAHCTDAIHLALLALNIKKGDEVIVPDLSWVASAAPIKYVGAKPVFVDINPDSLCIEPSNLIKYITKKTKAIISVDLFGNVAEYEKIKKICKKYKIYLIEDAAESIGANYRGKKSW